MEKELVEIYRENLKKTAYEKLYEELEKDENFRINRSNIHDFIDNKEIFQELKELNIPYEIKIEDSWNENRRNPDYNAMVSIYIPIEHQYKIKTEINYEDSNNKFEDEVIKTNEITVEDEELEEDDTSILIHKVSNIFMDIIFLGLGVFILVCGIYLLVNKMTEGEEFILIVIGGLSVFFRLRAKIKNRNKNRLN